MILTTVTCMRGYYWCLVLVFPHPHGVGDRLEWGTLIWWGGGPWDTLGRLKDMGWFSHEMAKVGIYLQPFHLLMEGCRENWVFSVAHLKNKRQWAEIFALEILMGLSASSSQHKVPKYRNRAQGGPCGLFNLQDFQLLMGGGSEKPGLILSRGWA